MTAVCYQSFIENLAVGITLLAMLEAAMIGAIIWHIKESRS